MSKVPMTNHSGLTRPPAAEPARSSARRLFQVGVFASALIVCFLIVGAFYRVRSAEIAQLEQRLRRERDREAELAVVRGEFDQYIWLLKDLELRLNVIEGLRSRRVGPAKSMTTVKFMTTLATGVDVFSAKFEGQRLALRGQARSLDSVANFLILLKRPGNFSDVQLRRCYQDNELARPIYKFDLDCIYSPAAPAPPAKK